MLSIPTFCFRKVRNFSDEYLVEAKGLLNNGSSLNYIDFERFSRYMIFDGFGKEMIFLGRYTLFFFIEFRAWI